MWTKTGVWRSLEAWRRRVESVAQRAEAEPPSNTIAYAHTGSLAFLPQDWIQNGDTIVSPTGDTFSNLQEAQKHFFAERAAAASLPEGELKTLLAWVESIDQDIHEINGAIVTTHQIDDWIHRGSHPILKHMSLYLFFLKTLL